MSNCIAMDTKTLMKIRQGYQNLIEGFFTLLFPPNLTCPLCSREFPQEGRFCGPCTAALQAWREAPRCSVCGRPIGVIKGRCLLCQENSPPFALARAAAPYDGVFRQVIQRLKFHGEQWLAEPLGSMMVETVKAEPLFGELELVLPVPLHRRRLGERGFNQSALLAKELSQGIGIPLGEGILIKKRETGHQIGLTREQRLVNLKDAFQVDRPRDILGRSVLLVDDIFTTGSTVAHGAEALLSAGATRVAVITWASGAS